MSLDLRALYHPSGLTGGRSDLEGEEHHCPCGCDPVREWEPFELGASQLGIEGTPAMLVIEALESGARANAPKPGKTARPWKGAAAEVGVVALPDGAKKCWDQKCGEVHGEVCEVSKRGHKTWYRVHMTEHHARVYRLPNGATARVRADSKVRL